MRALSFFGLCLREIPGINFLGLQQDWRALRILKRQVAIVAVVVIAVCSILPAAQLPAADAVGDSGQTDAAGTSPGSSPGTETPDLVGVATGDNKIKSGGKYDVSRIGQRKIGHGMNLYSLEKERALGHELAQEIESRSRLIGDTAITEYVNRIGQSVVRNSDARVPFTIKVVDDDEVNAFALPGGFFYVNAGLIMAADNEAELAGAMAHEIAHVAARHATRNATRAQIFNLASIPLIFVGGPVGYAVRQVAGLAVPMSFLKFSRDAEREADLLGIEYEYAAGYDPQSFVQFFEKLKAKEKEKHNFIGKAFITHPMTEDRIKRAQKEISTMLPPRSEYVVDTSEFAEVKARLANLVHEHRPDGGRPVLRRRGADGKDDSGPTLRRNTGR